jgi:hypothetical protein
MPRDLGDEEVGQRIERKCSVIRRSCWGEGGRREALLIKTC